MDGLFLSLATIIYSLISICLPQPNIVTTIIVSFLWMLKMAACIFLLWYFMKKWSERFETITYSESFGYGFIVCLFSSIVCSCYMYAQVEWIVPENTEQAFIMMKETMILQGTLNSTTENIIDMFQSNIGRLMMFGTLVYCVIFGAVASAITANFTKKNNPFGNIENQ